MGTFHLGLAALLLVLAGLTVVRGRNRERPSGWLQIALAAAVIAWAGASLSVVAKDHGPGLEVRGYVLEAPSEGPAALTLGSGEAADVPLADPYADDVHLVVRWTDDVPEIWNASAERRVEIDGRDIHDVVLEPGARLTLDGHEITVDSIGSTWPSVTVSIDDGEPMTFRAPAGRGAVGALPRIGGRIRTRLAWIVAEAEGGLSMRSAPRPLPGSGPLAAIVVEGNEAVLTFASATDRARHPIVVELADQAPFRPADRWTELIDGQLLTLGYSHFAVGVERSGRVSLRSVGPPARLPWPGADAVVLGAEPGLLAVGDADGTSLTLASLDPDGRRGFLRTGGTYVEGEASRTRIAMQAGDRALLPAAAGARMRLRVASRAGPSAALAGLTSPSDTAAWQALVVLAILYLVLTLAATRAGLLHARAAGVFHGSAILFAIGLLCLYRLSEPDDPRRALLVLRQLRLGVFGLTIASGLAIAAAWRNSRVPSVPGRLFRWLDGGAAGPRATWLYLAALAVLAAQLPFGETGIAIPGLGSIQPIEIARTLLVVYLAYWTARAIEDKRDRVRGAEGLAQRWRYMVHALPVLAVLGLCYGLHDISPIAVFGAFLAVLYGASLVRPSVALWPPRAWRDHLGVELLAVAAVLAGLSRLVLGDSSGTVAGRVRTWWDPWANSGEAYQAVTALWATASGGLFGLGWTGENGVLPPAVQDDFIVALLAARSGVVGVTLLAATFGVILLSGVAALGAERPVAEEPADRERAAVLSAATLWMLAIQAAVVLGSATGGLPVMGQPLPFVAAAGSHLLLFCLPAVGLVLTSARVRVPARARRPVAPTPSWQPWDFESVSRHSITEEGAR
ncbi:MAG: FtsW/RodA/SpoVE family cell cycle protein [Proteobacteria bacterium]|nr:FtsW/RodA/SpoVE family cell cycle protein [Pseudomonadota bacterium]